MACLLAKRYKISIFQLLNALFPRHEPGFWMLMFTAIFKTLFSCSLHLVFYQLKHVLIIKKTEKELQKNERMKQNQFAFSRNARNPVRMRHCVHMNLEREIKVSVKETNRTTECDKERKVKKKCRR